MNADKHNELLIKYNTLLYHFNTQSEETGYNNLRSKSKKNKSPSFLKTPKSP